jgi:hypothetical protein
MFRDVEVVKASPADAAALFDALSPRKQLERAIEIIENHASQAEQREDLSRKDDYTEKLRTSVKLLRAMIRDEASREAIALMALSLGQLWMQLRVDAHASAAMQAHRNRVPKHSVTDAQIREALDTCETKVSAAEKLGITTKQLRNRTKAMGKL